MGPPSRVHSDAMAVAKRMRTCRMHPSRKLPRRQGKVARAMARSKGDSTPWRRVANWPTAGRLGAFVASVAALAAPAAPWSTFGRATWLYASLVTVLWTWQRHVRVQAPPWRASGRAWPWKAAKEACWGWLGGVMAVLTLVLTFHSSNMAQCTCPGTQSAMHLAYGTGMGFAVAWVEEWLFRGWLVDELATDLPPARAKMLSALLFGLAHGSVKAMPGMVVLALGLSAAREITHGRIALPVGLHAGLVGTYYCIDAGKLLVVSAGKASWMTGHAQGNPLAGAIGLGVVSALAVVLHLLSQQIHRNDPNHMAQIT